MMRKKLQKLFSSALFLLLFAVSAMAQAPNMFNYQAVVRNASGEVIAGTDVSLRLSIIKGGAFGTPVFVETHKPTTNAFGLVSLAIGSGTLVSGNINTIDWSADVYFLKVELDATGGSTYTELGVSQILSVPYSMHAKESQILKGSITESQVSDLKNYLTAETDPVFNTSPAQGITGSNISNWNTTFGWGDHAGLYRPITYLPAWGEITSKPTTLGGYGITDAMGASHPANTIAESNITNWNNAFGWGNHSGLYVETGQPNSISSEMIIDGTITVADLNTTNVDARYVNVNQANSVTSSMIVNGTIAGADINPSTTINAGNYTYSTRRNVKIFLRASDFVGAKSGSCVGPDAWLLSSGNSYYRNTAGCGNLIGNIDLPHGAIVTNITCYRYDNDPTHDLGGNFYLWGRYHTSTTGGTSFSANATSTSGASTTMNTDWSHSGSMTINNNTSYYYLQVYFPEFAVSFNLRFYGCMVSYTVGSPGP